MADAEKKREFPEVNNGSAGMVEREEKVFWIKGPRLRQMRQLRGMSLRQFAEAVSKATGLIYDHKHIDRWERSATFQVGKAEMKAFINIMGK